MYYETSSCQPSQIPKDPHFFDESRSKNAFLFESTTLGDRVRIAWTGPLGCCANVVLGCGAVLVVAHLGSLRLVGGGAELLGDAEHVHATIEPVRLCKRRGASGTASRGVTQRETVGAVLSWVRPCAQDRQASSCSPQYEAWSHTPVAAIAWRQAA